MTEDFAVSVVIPFYNARDYVTQAVESALSQPETGEVLLIEDGSPDGGIETCRVLASLYPKVKFLQHPDGKPGAQLANLGKKNPHTHLRLLDAMIIICPTVYITQDIFQVSRSGRRLKRDGAFRVGKRRELIRRLLFVK
jgi:glycosyltransferase involved in cell wall biosynthesis